MTKLKQLAQCMEAFHNDPGLVSISGSVSSVSQSTFTIVGLSRFLKIGSLVRFASGHIGEAVRVDRESAIIKPYSNATDVQIGSRVHLFREVFTLRPDQSWRGRVLNAVGLPIDDVGPAAQAADIYDIDGQPPLPMSRARVTRPLKTGIRAVDVFSPLCAGQRIGIFAGSGVGKTTLLSMFAKSRSFDTIVVGLVGERGREVRDFIEEAIGDQMHKTVAVISTSDESAMMRRLAPKTATCIAEYFRDQGQSVLLILDSITRYAQALRDIGLAAGEPAVARGFTPSVFAELPKLLERAGPGRVGAGTITAIYSVLIDGDDHNDPIADNIRGTLDGHIILDRSIADQGRYPAIDVLRSISRLSQHAWSPEEANFVTHLKSLISRFEETKDLRMLGGYQQGSDAETDQAVVLVPRIYKALHQSMKAEPSESPFRELASAIQSTN